ncbi:MAG: hypothetical protein H7061_01450 [Bdellovibrionaceae bacterium]|nr:hypothetical protein [Bdellovibrio sp.]
MQENTGQQLFEQGLALQQQKKTDAALEFYQKALDKGPDQLTSAQASVVYHNMSTLAHEKADYLRAYIWSKKAVSLDSGNRIAKDSLEQFSKKFEPPQVAHQISGYENFKSLLRLGSVDAYSLLTLVLFFFSLALTFKYLIQRRKDQVAELPPKSFSWSSLGLAILTTLFLIFTIIRLADESTLRGLIVTEKTAVQTAPGENKPVIFEAQTGTEVEILRVQTDYIQVRYPGAFSGWVQRKNIEVMAHSF